MHRADLVVAYASILGTEALHAPFPVTFRHAIDSGVKSCQQQAAVGALCNPLNFEVLHLVLRVHLHGIEAEDGTIRTAHYGASRATDPKIVVAVFKKGEDAVGRRKWSCSRLVDGGGELANVFPFLGWDYLHDFGTEVCHPDMSVVSLRDGIDR